MKLFVILTLVGFASAGIDMFNPYAKVRKWQKMKAMEGCYGEETMQIFHVNMKKHMKKCMGMPVPELKVLEMFKPHRMIQSMLMGAKDMHEEKLMKLVAGMKSNEAKQQMTFIPYPVAAPQANQDDSHMMMKMMKMMMMKKMMKHMMNGHDMDMDMDMDMVKDESDDMDETMAEYFKGMNLKSYDIDDDDLGQLLMNILKKSSKRRNTRSTDSELFDLGEELSDKLAKQMDKYKAKMGNMTCFLQEFHWIDDEMNLDLDGMLKELEIYKIKDEWLVEKHRKLIRLCHATAESLPREVINECKHPKMAKVMAFCKCRKMAEYKACMQNDVKHMLEKHFSPLDKLVEETGIEEKLLLPLTKKLLDDSFEM